MIPPLKHIIVVVNRYQNDEVVIGGNTFKTGKNYNENFREKNPVIALVIEGYGEIKKGTYIVCNYNYFDSDSPLQLSEIVFSIPVNEEIFAIVNEDGTLKPINGNLLVERIVKDTLIELPDELKKKYINQGTVVKGIKKYFTGQHIFWLPYSDYAIHYTWNGEEKKAIKIHESEIVGYLKN